MKLPNSVVGIDLGGHSLKAVRLQKVGAQYALTRIAIVPTPSDGSGTMVTEQALANALKQLTSLVKASGADVHFTVNSPGSTVRYVEFPQIPLSDIRSALKLNSTTYLRQKFDNYTFDACALDSESDAALKAKPKKGASTTHGKIKLLVGGLPTTETILYYHAARRAGLRPQSLQLAPVSFINCFGVAHPDLFSSQAVALLDLGFLSSSLTILDKGKPLLTRTVPIGAKQITEYIAQSGSMDLARAETTKMSDDQILSDATSKTCVTLVREVRSSINFFEKNNDQPISKVYVTGGSSGSPAVVAILAQDIGSSCEMWDPTVGLQINLPPEQQDVFAKHKAAFSGAIGTARAFTSDIKTPASTSQPQPSAPAAA